MAKDNKGVFKLIRRNKQTASWQKNSKQNTTYKTKTYAISTPPKTGVILCDPKWGAFSSPHKARVALLSTTR